jgi:hypothetical protein
MKMLLVMTFMRKTATLRCAILGGVSSSTKIFMRILGQTAEVIRPIRVTHRTPATDLEIASPFTQVKGPGVKTNRERNAEFQGVTVTDTVIKVIVMSQ